MDLSPQPDVGAAEVAGIVKPPPVVDVLMLLNLPLKVSPFTLESPDDKKPESPLLFNFIDRNSCISELTIGSVVVDDGDDVERVYTDENDGFRWDVGVDADLGDSSVASCYGHC